MIGPLLAASTSLSVAAALPWTDAGAPDPGTGPLAVVIPQPGLRPIAYTRLVAHLEASGLSTVVVPLPIGPDALVTTTLPAVADAARGRPIVWVGHGHGGRAALTRAGLPEHTCGVAALGVPLVIRSTDWPVPLPLASDHPGGLVLTPGTGLWPLTRAESGVPSAWLGRVSADWLAYLQAAAGEPVALPTDVPAWMGVAPLDELAPPETVGTIPNSVVFSRWGMLRGWRADATTAELLTDPRPAAHLARWALRTCA